MDRRDRRNAVLNTAGEALWGLQGNMVVASTVLTVLLRSYGASATMIGAIAAIETAGVSLPQLLGAYLFTSRKHLQRNMILWHILSISAGLFAMAILTALVDCMPRAVYRWSMLGAFAFLCVGIGIVVAVWVDWLAQIFNVKIRGTAMGIAMFASSFAGTAGALLAGWIVTRVPSPLSYAILYMLACVISVIAILVFFLMEDPATTQPDVRSKPRLSVLVARFKESLMDRNFRAYLAGRIISACGFSILPFIAVHFASASGGSLEAGAIVSCGSAMTAGMAVGSLVLGRLGDRYGHRLGILIGTGGQVLTLGLLLGLGGLPGCLLAYFGAGVCALGGWVSHSNIVLETCPHDHRVAHISVGNLVIGSVAALLPLLAGVVVAQWGTLPLFAGSVVFSGLAFLWFIFLVKEPRDYQKDERLEPIRDAMVGGAS